MQYRDCQLSCLPPVDILLIGNPSDKCVQLMIVFVSITVSFCLVLFLCVSFQLVLESHPFSSTFAQYEGSNSESIVLK